jgi:ribose/xylose/arabinose/galactoside ABC-type transport system permease subunit
MSATSLNQDSRKPRFRLRREYGLLVLLIAIMAWLALTEPAFLTPRNVLRVLRDKAAYGVLAAGMTFVILTGGIDLSVGSATALAAVSLGVVWQKTQSPWLAVLAGLGVGTACGAANGLLIAKGRIPALIVTLATLSVFRGAAFALAGSNSFGGFAKELLSWSRDDLLGLPVPLWITAAFFIGGGIYLARTDGGRAVYAVGANAAAARLSGVPVDRLRFLLYVFSGLLAGLAAVLYSANYNSAKPDIGVEYELMAITMVVLGGTSVSGGEGSMAGTALGYLTLIFIRNGIELKGWPGEYHGLAVAALLIGALLLDASVRRRVLLRT